MRARRRRTGRWILLGLVCVLAIALGIARLYFNGPRLAAFIKSNLFHDIRGEVQVDSVEWPLLGVFGRHLPVTIRGLKIIDPYGEVVLDVPLATAKIDWLAVALPGTHDVIVDDLVIEKGYCRVKQVPAPPDAGGGANEVTLIAALQPAVHHTPGGPHGPFQQGPVIELRTMKLSGVHLELIFPGWSATADGLSAEGYFRHSLRNLDARTPDLKFMLAPRAETAALDLGAVHFDLVGLDASRFGQYPTRQDALAFDANVATTKGAKVHVSGAILDLYDPHPHGGKVDVTIDAHQAGPVVAAFTRGVVGGPAGPGAAQVRIEGPMSGPTLHVAARGLGAQVGFPATVDHVVAAMNLGTEVVELVELEVRALGGRAEATGKGNILGRAVGELEVTVTSPVNLAPYLPADVVRAADGARASGHVRLRGRPPVALVADRIDVELGKMRLTGAVRLVGDEIRIADLHVEHPDGSADVRGLVDKNRKARRLALEFSATLPRVSELLRRVHVPPVAQSVELTSGRVSGTFSDPVVAADARVTGVPLIPRVDASFTFHGAGARLDVQRIIGDPFGGNVNGSATLFLGPTPRIAAASLTARDLDLQRVPYTGGLLAGRAGFSLSAQGGLADPRGALVLDVAELALADRRLGDAHLDLATRTGADKRPELAVNALHVGGGVAGSVDVRGAVGLDRGNPLALDLAVSRVPFTLVPAIHDDKQLRLDGRVSLDAHVGGTWARPTVKGRATVTGFALLDTLLGLAEIDLEPWPSGRVHFSGKLFQGKFGVDGSFAFSPEALLTRKPHAAFDVAARITFNKVDLEEFIPGVASLIDAHGWVSGWIDVQTSPDLRAELHVTRTRIDLASADPRQLPIPIENEGEIAVVYDGATRTATFLHPMTLASPTGKFSVSGSASAGQLALKVKGEVQLALISFYIRSFVEKSRGNMEVDVTVAGTPLHPQLQGTIAFRDVAVQRPGQETELRVPRGSLVLSNDKIHAEGITVEVDGQTLGVDGDLTLANFKPVMLDARVDGRAAGKLVEVLLPRQVSSASGSARVSLRLKGDPLSPAVGGIITIDRPLVIAPRAFHRELRLDSGRIQFSNQQVTIDKKTQLTGSIDDGRLALYGQVDIKNYEPVRAALHAEVDAFQERIPEVLTLELGAHLDLQLAAGRLKLSGTLDIIDGRYIQGFSIKDAITPQRTSERSAPFWASSELLAGMSLDLHLKTAGVFKVANNLADLTLDGDVAITGTPARPVFHGLVRALTPGALKFPGTKIREFALDNGDVAFDSYRTFPNETPTVTLKAEAPFVDLDGVEHLVTLEISGTLSILHFTLSTNTGLNTLKTSLLIMTGRTTDELRARARGDASTSGGSSTASSANLSTQYSATGGANPLVTFSDEILKDVTGDFMAVLIEDPLKNLLGLDCARVGIGTESLQITLCKNFQQYFNFNLDLQQGFRGWSRQDVRFNLLPTDDVYLQGEYLRVNSAEVFTQIQNESALRLQLKFKFEIP